MSSIENIAAEWASEQARSEAETFEQAMSRIIPAEFKVNDEIEQAFRAGLTARKRCDDLRIEQIATHYGFTSQADMLCEESAEYMVALNKLRRGDPNAYENIKEEVTDVLIVARQLRYLLGYEEIDRLIEEKLERQIQRIANEDQA